MIKPFIHVVSNQQFFTIRNVEYIFALTTMFWEFLENLISSLETFLELPILV